MRHLIAEMREWWELRDQRINTLDEEFHRYCRSNDQARRLTSIPGISVGRLNVRISGCLEEVPTLVQLEQVADVTEGAPKRIKGSGFGFAPVRLDLGKGLLNRVHVRPVRRQEQG